MLSKEFLLKEYQTAKDIASKSIQQKRYNKSIAYYRYAARIAWQYPILHEFCDDDIEENIYAITQKISYEISILPDKSAGVVLYSSWLGDNNALIEQYLYYFIERNIKVLLIVPDKKAIRNAAYLMSRIQNASNVKLFIPEIKSSTHKIQAIRKAIAEFSPEKIFLHFFPNDVVGFASFCGIKGVNRFFINHGDHVFSLGKKCADYFIEFRKFGIALSSERRGIDLNKILHIPFYPINNKTTFNGFPFETKDKVIAISGASLYKYYMDKELSYFKVIARLLKENENLMFCLCGSGNPDKIQQIFIENTVADRFYYLGQRNDFYALVGKCDILFESYPFKGGLVMLFAISQNIPVVGITKADSSSGSIQDFLNIHDYTEPTNLDEFYIKAAELIQSNEERNKLAKILSENQLNYNSFTEKLDLLMKDNIEILHPDISDYKLLLDDAIYLDEYLNLPAADLSTLYHDKLFLIKNQLAVKERISLSIYLLKNTKINLKKIIRYTILGLFGV
ncbi:MAG: hypothetical protein ACOYO1_13055 [Bacteroidales bacterium]